MVARRVRQAPIQTKNTRSTNQKKPAQMMTHRSANGDPAPQDGLRARDPRERGGTTSTMTSCPISTPRLNAKRDQPSAAAADQLREHAGEPEAMHEAESERDPRTRVAPARPRCSKLSMPT